jgi:hypothetical protein
MRISASCFEVTIADSSGTAPLAERAQFIALLLGGLVRHGRLLWGTAAPGPSLFQQNASAFGRARITLPIYRAPGRGAQSSVILQPRSEPEATIFPAQGNHLQSTGSRRYCGPRMDCGACVQGEQEWI